MNLITNRSRADVDRANMLAERIRARTAAPDEWAEWLNGVQGAYNATDYNRVGQGLIYLAGILNGYGYAVTVSPKIDWAYSDVPTPAQQLAYLADVRTIRNVMAIAIAVAEDWDSPTFEEANDLERILFEAERALRHMAAAFIHSGTTYSGQGGIRI